MRTRGAWRRNVRRRRRRMPRQNSGAPLRKRSRTRRVKRLALRSPSSIRRRRGRSSAACFLRQNGVRIGTWQSPASTRKPFGTISCHVMRRSLKTSKTRTTPLLPLFITLFRSAALGRSSAALCRMGTPTRTRGRTSPCSSSRKPKAPVSARRRFRQSRMRQSGTMKHTRRRTSRAPGRTSKPRERKSSTRYRRS